MVEDAEVSIANDALRTNVVNFLAKQRDCNIRTTSVYRALQNPEAFKGVAEDHMVGVVEQLKTLAACAGVLYVPEAVPVLMRANLTSAFCVAEMAESTFLHAYSDMLGEETPPRVSHTNAINSRIRNEQALMKLRGTGLAILDQWAEDRDAHWLGASDCWQAACSARSIDPCLAAWIMASVRGVHRY